MKQSTVLAAGVLAILLLVPAAAFGLSVTTYFGPGELIGAPGLYGTATATMSLYSTSSNGGIIDFALTNTSLRKEMAAGKYANAFITEFQFDLPGSFAPVFSDCTVIAPIGVRFAQGAGSPVIATLIARMLDWDFGNGTGGGIYARAYEATEKSNNNAIFSGNALNASGIPVEDYAAGFLNDGNWDGAVFDTIIFRVKVADSRPLTEDDLRFFACGHLTLKYQGGNGSAWVPNHCEQVPEPSSLILLLSVLPGGALLFRGRKR